MFFASLHWKTFGLKLLLLTFFIEFANTMNIDFVFLSHTHTQHCMGSWRWSTFYWGGVAIHLTPGTAVESLHWWTQPELIMWQWLIVCYTSVRWAVCIDSTGDVMQAWLNQNATQKKAYRPKCCAVVLLGSLLIRARNTSQTTDFSDYFMLLSDQRTICSHYENMSVSSSDYGPIYMYIYIICTQTDRHTYIDSFDPSFQICIPILVFVLNVKSEIGQSWDVLFKTSNNSSKFK